MRSGLLLFVNDKSGMARVDDYWDEVLSLFEDERE